jgi:hypothetical protein
MRLPAIEQLLPAGPRTGQTGGYDDYFPTRHALIYARIGTLWTERNVLFLYRAGETERLAEVPLGEDGPVSMVQGISVDGGHLPVLERLYVCPERDLAVSVPYRDGGKRLVMAPLGLGSSGTLVAVSEPAPVAVRGAPYRYQLRLAGSPSGVTYRLGEAPERMEASAGGEVTWTAARQLDPGSDHGVTVEFEAAGRRAGLQRFYVRVE